MAFTFRDAARISRSVLYTEQVRDGQATRISNRAMPYMLPTYLMKRESSGSDWLKGTSATCEYYAGALGSEAGTGETDDVYNRMGDVPAGDLWLYVAPMGNGLELLVPECPDEE